MAHSLSAAYDIAIVPFVEAVAKGLAELESLGLVRTDQVPTLRRTLIEETGDESAFASEASSLSYSDVKAANKDFTVSDAAKGFKFSWGQFADMSSEQISQLGTQLGSRAAARCAATLYTTIEALAATAHPLAGAGAGQVGAGKFYVDTGLAGNQTLGSAFTWANKISMVLTEEAIKAAMSLLLQQRTYSGEYIQPSLSDLVLICHPDDAWEAKRIAGSANLGIDNGINVLAGTFRVSSYPLADTDSWYLLDSTSDAVALWMRQTPDLIISESQERTHVYMTSRRRAAGVYGMTGQGIVASIP